MARLILRGHLFIPTGILAAAKEELPAHIELSQQEEGCLVFEVTQDVNNPNVFHVYEEFVDRAALEAHQERVGNSHWGRLTADAERDFKIIEGG